MLLVFFSHAVVFIRNDSFYGWNIFLLDVQIWLEEDKNEKARKCMVLEKLNIMCSDTSKNIFDKFMIARNVESKKMNKMKNRTRTENTKNV